MEQLEGETLREMIVSRLKQFQEWLKPNPHDTILVISLKMIYKAIAVLVLIAFSPVIIIVLLFVFFAAL
jgi:hypothetical protein